MSPVSSARAAPSPRDAAAVVRPAAWVPRHPAPLSVAVVLVGGGTADDAEATTQRLRTMLPRSEVVVCGDAGADRAALVRRLFADTDADVYVLAERLGDPLAVARAVSAVERDEMDLVAVTNLDMPGDAPADRGDRLLGRVLDYLFGCGARHVPSGVRACSRRFARSYKGDGTPLDLTLHALRLRMPVGEVTSLDAADRARTGPARRDVGGWWALAKLVAMLFAEERPRRTFGCLGIGTIAAGVAVALPAVRAHHWDATLPSGPASALSLGLIALGTGGIGAGLFLDTLAKARQDVRRLGYLAIPRRAEQDAQSSVS